MQVNRHVLNENKIKLCEKQTHIIDELVTDVFHNIFTPGKNCAKQEIWVVTTNLIYF